MNCDSLRLSRFTPCNKKPNKSFPSFEPFTPGLTDLLQFVQDPSQLLLSICQLPTTRIVHTKATHDGIHNDQGETILVIDHQTSCFHQKLFEMLRGIASERWSLSDNLFVHGKCGKASTKSHHSQKLETKKLPTLALTCLGFQELKPVAAKAHRAQTMLSIAASALTPLASAIWRTRSGRKVPSVSM